MICLKIKFINIAPQQYIAGVFALIFYYRQACVAGQLLFGYAFLQGVRQGLLCGD